MKDEAGRYLSHLISGHCCTGVCLLGGLGYLPLALAQVHSLSPSWKYRMLALQSCPAEVSGRHWHVKKGQQLHIPIACGTRGSVTRTGAHNSWRTRHGVQLGSNSTIGCRGPPASHASNSRDSNRDPVNAEETSHSDTLPVARGSTASSRTSSSNSNSNTQAQDSSAGQGSPTSRAGKTSASASGSNTDACQESMPLEEARSSSGAGGGEEAELEAPLVPISLQDQPAASTAAATSWRWKGAKLGGAAAAVGSALLLRFLVPVPEGLSDQAWSQTALFLGTLIGLILEPLPVGACALVSLTLGLAVGCFTWEQGLAAVNNQVVWLIVVSFFMAKGFQKTGLGERLANLLVKAAGSSSLGLAVSLVVAEALVAPTMPSTTARAAGVFMPVIVSVAEEAGSYPGEGSSRTQLGAFLTQAQFQASTHSSNLFLTAAAQNLLCLQLAAGVGAPVEEPFMTWLAGAWLPGLIGLLGTPCLVYWLSPPEVKQTPEAPAAAVVRLQQMGPMRQDELLMLMAVLLAVALWVFGGQVGVAPVVAALLAVSLLLVSGVLTWQECLAYTPAWDTLIWFSVLISLSMALQDSGVLKYLSDSAAMQLSALHLSPMGLFGALHLLFFILHYLFASQTAHVAALYGGFCALMLSAGVPPKLAAMSLAYNVNLFGSITHYASGQAAVYYGSGYIRLQELLPVGAACAVFGLAVWGTTGMLWWKFLGWY